MAKPYGIALVFRYITGKFLIIYWRWVSIGFLNIINLAIMQKQSTYSQDLSLRQKILYVPSILRKVTADEIAMEIMELEGITTEGCG